jgi:hypothetical protein
MRPEIWGDIHSRTNHNCFPYVKRPRNQLFDRNAYFRAIPSSNGTLPHWRPHTNIPNSDYVLADGIFSVEQ